MIPLSPQNEPMTLHEDHVTRFLDFSPQKRYHTKGYPKNKEIIKVMKKKIEKVLHKVCSFCGHIIVKN